ncbi:MAG: Nucleoside diphosphate kinase, partial [uncultured Corynebacteriales bacterium]
GHRAHPRPGQARRRRPRPGRGGHRPHRAQGPPARRAGAADAGPGDRGDALRRAPGEAVLRRAGRVHHLRPARRGRGRGAAGDRGVPAARRSHRPGEGGDRQHPRRPRHRGPEQHRARLRLARVGQARDRPLLPRPL